MVWLFSLFKDTENILIAISPIQPTNITRQQYIFWKSPEISHLRDYYIFWKI